MADPGKVRLPLRIDQLDAGTIILLDRPERTPIESQVDDGLGRVGGEVVAQKLDILAKIMVKRLGNGGRVKGGGADGQRVGVGAGHIKKQRNGPDEQQKRPTQDVKRGA